MANTITRIKFYKTSSGRSPVEEFINEQPSDIQVDFGDALSQLEGGCMLSLPLSRPLSNIHAGLHELRLKDRHGQIRVFYFIKRGGFVFMLHAIHKKSQEIQKRDIDIILKRLREILYAVENSDCS